MGFLAPFFEVSESSNCWSEKAGLGGLPGSSGVATAVLFGGLWGSLEKWHGKEDDTRGVIRHLILSQTQPLLSFTVNFTQKIDFLCLPHQGFCQNALYFLSGLLVICPSSAFASVFPKSFWFIYCLEETKMLYWKPDCVSRHNDCKTRSWARQYLLPCVLCLPALDWASSSSLQ